MDFRSLPMPDGLSVRPSSTSDQPFLNQLFKSTRDDLDFIDGELDFIEHVKESQQEAQADSYQDMFPNAMYFVIEYHNERAGRVILDFGANEIRIVDISLIPAARGKGLATGVLQGFIHCAEQARAPLKLAVLSRNVAAKGLYAKLGFVLEEIIPPREYLAYFPSSHTIQV